MSSPKVPKTPANREDLTTKLIDSFKDLIARGVLKPGVKLPPERDLAQRFGVSRSSLRHALKSLDMLGIITQRVGDGTYLNPDPSKIMGAPLEFLLLLDGISEMDLAETRLIVEPELAARAATQATSEQIANLRAALDKMKGEHTDAEMIELDISFHEAIFEASGNRLASRLFVMLQRLMFASMEVTSKHVDWTHTLEFHTPILKAIEEHNADEARKCMVAHLNDARHILEHAGKVKAHTGSEEDFPMLTRRQPAAEKPQISSPS